MIISQGIIAGIIFGLGVLLAAYIPRFKWITVAVTIAIVAPLALSGFVFPAEAIGISDWDYYLSYHHNLLQSIQTHNSFPFWNPYTCGGTAGLGDPEFSVLSPLFLLELAFGESAGMRWAIIFSVVIGSWGVLSLCKRLGLSAVAASIAALGMFFGTVNILESVEGHQNILAAMWVPWVLWGWLSAYRTKSSFHAILTGIFLALMFFQGGIYLLMYTAFTFLGLTLFSSQRVRALTLSIVSGLWGMGLSAVKLIPVFLWLQEFQDTAYASSTNTLAYLHLIFFGRITHTVREIIPGQGGGWHEYGAYIGYTIAVMAFIGLLMNFKQRIVRILAVSTLLAILIASSGPILKPFFDQVSFLPRSNVSRVILFAVIPISLLASYGLESLLKKQKRLAFVIPIIVTVAAIELITLLIPLSQQAFIVPANVPAVSPAPSPLAFTTRDYKTRVGNVDYTRAYSATLAGYGTMNYCSVLTPPASARTIFDEGDNGIIMVASSDRTTRGTYVLDSWNPNMVKARVVTDTPSVVVLNTNYAKGWKVNNQTAVSIDGRVGMNIEAGSQEIIFTYRSPGFVPGLLITLLSLMGAIAVSYRQHRRSL